MTDDIEDNMAIPLEDCQMAMEGFQALESQNSLQVPRPHDAYVIELMESLLDNDEVEVLQGYTYVAELERALLEDDGAQVPKTNAYASKLEKVLLVEDEAYVIFEYAHYGWK
jgi:hypothetical protein